MVAPKHAGVATKPRATLLRRGWRTIETEIDNSSCARLPIVLPSRPLSPLFLFRSTCARPPRVSITKRSCSTIPSEWNVVESRLMTHVLCFRLEKTVPVTDSGWREGLSLFSGSLGICLSLGILPIIFFDSNRSKFLFFLGGISLRIKNWFDCFCNFFEIVENGIDES